MDTVLDNFSACLQSKEVLITLVERTMDHSTIIFERVLLDGGPHRNFVVEDARVIEGDKDRLKSLFIAEG